MMRFCNPRSDEECANRARFKVTADGYPQPMFSGVCDDHLAVVLERDASAPGSTRRWTVELLNDDD